eukprot:14208366-Alexandrium_andersonii.AAC.1
MRGVVDAKDVYDKAGSDAASHGQQRSLSFSVGWVRQALKTPSTRLRWTATENMIVDGVTKRVDLSHLRSTLPRGAWAI